MKAGSLLINTSRGAVIDNKALLVLLQHNHLHAVLDVYEDEPKPELVLLDLLDIATAHIAGYSLQGKIRGTMMVVDSLFQFFSIDKPMPDLLSPLIRQLDVNISDLSQVVLQAYDITADSHAFLDHYKKVVNDKERALVFDNYRKHYPVRYEWGYTDIKGGGQYADDLEALGFQKNKRA